MITISAFADEISPDLDCQMKICRENGVMCIDVRGIDGKNVSAFTPEEAREYRRRLDDNGFTVPCLGSPIGKIRLGEDFGEHLDLLKHCFAIADIFGTRRIRVFSFYDRDGKMPGDDDHTTVMSQMGRMVAAAAEADMVLLHENEKNIYGSKPDGVLDIMSSLGGDNLRGIFDPANYVEEGVAPFDQAWSRGLAENTHFFHIKDKKVGGRGCVPAGEGDGQLLEVFQDLAKRDWSGYMTLEPHLSSAGQFAGFSGPDLFAKAATALKKICRQTGLSYR